MEQQQHQQPAPLTFNQNTNRQTRSGARTDGRWYRTASGAPCLRVNLARKVCGGGGCDCDDHGQMLQDSLTRTRQMSTQRLAVHALTLYFLDHISCEPAVNGSLTHYRKAARWVLFLLVEYFAFRMGFKPCRID